jgi:hypothetical protein
MSDSKFFRQYLDILNEGPPAGVGPNAPVRPVAPQQPGQPDTFTKMLPGMGNKAINAGKGLVDPYAKTMANFTPGSPYYQQNVANNPAVKAKVDAFMQTAPTAGQLGANIDATQQSFNKALTQKPTVGGTSAEYEKAAVQTGLPAVPAPTTEERDDDTDDGKLMRKYMDFLDEAPIQAVNPNDPNAAAFGKKINAPAQATPQVAANTGPATAINPNDKNAAAFGKQINAPAANTQTATTTQTPTAQPAAHVVDPNRKYGGGYDPTKVQYASTSSNPTQPNPAPVKQNTATSANMGGYAQSAQPNPTPPAKLAGGTTSQQTNNQSSGYTAQSQAQNTTAATNAAAPTFTGMAGNTQPTTAQSGLAGQYVSANQPQAATTAATQPTSDVLATQALQSQDQGVAGTSKGIPAAFGQVAEDDEDDVDLKRIRELIRK